MPADAEASEAIDLTLAEPVPATAALGSVHDVRRVQSESEVPEVCTVTYMLQRLTRFAVWHLCGLVQVPATASRSATDLPPHATRPERQQPSNAWLDTTESIATDSKQHDLVSVASSLVQPR